MAVASGVQTGRDGEDRAVKVALRLSRKLRRSPTTRQHQLGASRIKNDSRTALRWIQPVPSRSKNHFPVYATRQMLFDPSSVTSSEPSGATVIPTGRPQTLPSTVTKPVTKSSYSPLAWPVWCSGTRITS